MKMKFSYKMQTYTFMSYPKTYDVENKWKDGNGQSNHKNLKETVTL